MRALADLTRVGPEGLAAMGDVDDPEVATFLACWFYEETFHGIALSRFLEAAGAPVGPRPTPRGRESLGKRLEATATAMVSKAWPDFCAVMGLPELEHDSRFANSTGEFFGLVQFACFAFGAFRFKRIELPQARRCDFMRFAVRQ